MKDYPKPQVEEGDFLEVIEKAIGEKRHVGYLRNVLKNYKKYKDFFAKQAFTSKNPRGYIYQFKVIFREDQKVWRIIELKGNQNLEDLADSIIDSMYWCNDHMHRFTWPDEETNNCKFCSSQYVVFYNAEGWEDDPHPTLKTDQIRIDDVDYDKFPKLYFEFDFGDSHEFDIELKMIRGPKVGETKTSFPQILKENGEPPEQYPDYDNANSSKDFEDEELPDIEDDENFQKFARQMQLTQSQSAGHDCGAFLKEYFKLHEKLPKEIEPADIERAIDILGSSESEVCLLKLAILVLAHSGKDKAVKALTNFGTKAEGEMKFWTDTAIDECSLFLDENRIK